MPEPALLQTPGIRPAPTRLAVIWIDWYAYHLARFRGLLETPALAGRVQGIELLGGVGVHAGLRFREDRPDDLPVTTLLPEASWQTTSHARLALRLWRQLDRLDPEAVLVPGYYTLPGLAAAVWARAHERQSILMTESTAHDHARSRWKEWIKGRLLRALFDSAVTGGVAHRRYLRELGFPERAVAGCYDVVDNAGIGAQTAALRAQAALDKDGLRVTPYFLYVGRLAPEKGIDTLLAAWVLYREDGGTWPLVLAGDGPEAMQLRAAAAASDFVDEVHFTGHRAAHELLPLYAGAGCFVLPSTREPWGLVVNEAMAAALPVLVSDRCGCAEDLVVDGQNGFRFVAGERAGLARLLAQIASLPAASREAMGRQSAEQISSYTPQRFGIEIASLLGISPKSEHGRVRPPFEHA